MKIYTEYNLTIVLYSYMNSTRAARYWKKQTLHLFSAIYLLLKRYIVQYYFKTGEEKETNKQLFETTPDSQYNKYAVSYQVGGQAEEVGDPLVVRGLITTAGLDEHADLGSWGIVLQGGNHQSTGQPGDLTIHTEMSFSFMTLILTCR